MTPAQQAIALTIIQSIVKQYFSVSNGPQEVEASECVFVIDEVLSDQNLTEQSFVFYGVTPPPIISEKDFDVCMG